MSPNFIRPIAICIFRDKGRILTFEVHDPHDGSVLYRPLGGGIEYGEHSHDAIVREMREEIGAEITDVRYLRTIENIFTYRGEVGHEIVQVYDARFVDESFYTRELITVTEDNGMTFKGLWKPLDAICSGAIHLVPEELLPLLCET